MTHSMRENIRAGLRAGIVPAATGVMLALAWAWLGMGSLAFAIALNALILSNVAGLFQLGAPKLPASTSHSTATP